MLLTLVVACIGTTYSFAQSDAPTILEHDQVNTETPKQGEVDRVTGAVKGEQTKEQATPEDKKNEGSGPSREVLIIPKPKEKLRLTRMDASKTPAEPKKEK